MKDPDWMPEMGASSGRDSAPFGNVLPQHISAGGACCGRGTAQAWALPADTSLNAPCGGVAWPSEFSPQQAMAAFWRSAQVKWRPADIWRKSVWAGAFRASGLSPQQAIAPFSRRPQAWALPAVMRVKATSAGGEVGGAGSETAAVAGAATFGGEAAADGDGAVGGMAAGDVGAVAGMAAFGGEGAGWGGGGWAQAARARQRAAHMSEAAADGRVVRRAIRAIGIISV